MKLIRFYKREEEHCVALLQGKEYSFVQCSVGWYDDDSDVIPFVYLTMGNRRLFDFLFCLYKFSFCFTLISPNWENGTSL